MAQNYKPYRSGLLTREQLHQVTQLRSTVAVRDTIVDWLVIFAAWTAVALLPTWWMAAIAVPIVGSRFYALLIIAHDGLHRRLFSDKRKNDLWNDVFILGAIGAITRHNRLNHMRHHAVTCLPDDPDRFKYCHAGKDGTFQYLLFLSGISSLKRAVWNVFFSGSGATPARRTGEGDGYQVRDFVIVVVWQLALIGGLTVAIGWWAYPVLWLLPVYLFGYRADLTRVFAEHSMQLADAEADDKMRLITYRSNWFERQFFAPHNMNCHIAHHLWPSIPYYNLPSADRLIRQSPLCDDTLVWRGSYLRYLLDYWLWRRKVGFAPVS